MSTVPKPWLTPEQYLARERKADFKSEYYRGETFAMAGASANHNLIVLNAGSVLRDELKKRPCRVYPSDLKLLIRASGMIVYPDLMVVCGEPQFEYDHGEVLTNPNVVVEVLSPTSEAYDRGIKFEHYRTVPSLQHYVIISQDRVAIECYTRNADDRWSLFATQSVTDAVTLPRIDCSLPVAEVYDKVVFDAEASEKS